MARFAISFRPELSKLRAWNLSDLNQVSVIPPSRKPIYFTSILEIFSLDFWVNLAIWCLMN